MGIPCEWIHVDYFKSEQFKEDFIKINPNAALPALVDDDLVLWKSNSLLQYDADKYGKSEFYPTGLKIRADTNRWLLWEASAWFESRYVYLVEKLREARLGCEPKSQNSRRSRPQVPQIGWNSW